VSLLLLIGLIEEAAANAEATYRPKTGGVFRSDRLYDRTPRRFLDRYGPSAASNDKTGTATVSCSSTVDATGTKQAFGTATVSSTSSVTCVAAKGARVPVTVSVFAVGTEYADNFNRADGPLSGGIWGTVVSAEIVSNTLRRDDPAGAGIDASAYLATTMPSPNNGMAASVRAQITIAPASGGFWFEIHGTSFNGWFQSYYGHDGYFDITDENNTVSTETGPVLAVGDWVRLDVHGGVAYLYLNDALLLSRNVTLYFNSSIV
jgi:hypothetical protein